MEAMEWCKFIFGSIFLVFGTIIFIMELFGVFRFRYVLNRMHVAAIGDTFGIGVSMVGLMIMNGFNYTSLKLFCIVVFLWLASPVSSHVIARLEITTNEKLREYCEVEE